MNCETVILDYKQEYERLLAEFDKETIYQKEKYEKEKKRLEKELNFYREIIKSILNIRG